MMAAQLKQGKSGFVTEDYVKSRKLFDLQMESIKTKPTFVKQVARLYVYLYKVLRCLRVIIILLQIKNYR